VTVTLRSHLPEDEPFLRRLIIDTVALELGAAAWPEPLRTQILELQYKGRRKSSRGSIIQADGEDSGWIVVSESPDLLYLSEILVLPEMRERGIGTAAIGQVLASADSTRRRVLLHVSSANPGAIRLYERLGFRRVDEDPVQFSMEYSPGSL
jgi:ribosomal protein S18 acetylase RimI-like enzyme